MVLPRFLAELKHRNVYRAAVVYAAVGWALLEAADVVLPRLGLPDWTVCRANYRLNPTRVFESRHHFQ